MAVKRLSNIKIQYDDGSGVLASNYRLFFYASGSSTKQNTYNSSTGSVANSNPIVLNALGEPAVEIWLTEGLSYKVGLAIPGTDDPPASFVWTEDNISGVNDTATSIDEWKASLLTPTFVSATSFTLAGDQTTTFHVGRRLKTTNTVGTIYSSITGNAFAAGVTTVTVENDSGVLDVGLSAVSYSLISQLNGSDPAFTDQRPVVVNVTDRTKRVRISASGLTAGKTRVVTMSDSDVTLGLPRGYLAGLALANNAGAPTTSIDIAVGACRDSGNAVDIVLAGGLTKQLDAVWAVGTNAGGRASGAAIANTTYFVFAIRRPDTAVVDVAFDTSATGANIAANTNAAYTQIRRIGAIVRSAGAILAFIQDGDKFVWTAAPVADVNAANPGTAAVTRTLTLPVGLRFEAILGVGIATSSATNSVNFRVSDLSTTDVAATASTAQVSATYPGVGNTTNSTSECRVHTNTSAQVRSRASLSDANVTVLINTTGWVDRRGRDD